MMTDFPTTTLVHSFFTADYCQMMKCHVCADVLLFCADRAFPTRHMAGCIRLRDMQPVAHPHLHTLHLSRPPLPGL